MQARQAGERSWPPVANEVNGRMTGVGVQEESSQTERRVVSELTPGRLRAESREVEEIDPILSVSDPDIFLLTSLVIHDEPDE